LLEAIASATPRQGEENQSEAILADLWRMVAERKMYSQELLKPDGRKLTLYSRYPIAEDIRL